MQISMQADIRAYSSSFRLILKSKKHMLRLRMCYLLKIRIGKLVLNSPYKISINNKVYLYSAGTSNEIIWKDLFSLHSKGAEFVSDAKYEDIR